MKRMILLLATGLISSMQSAPSHATPLDFMFSFTGTVPPGSVAGTVTGEIFGLTEGATSGATNVVVDSYPAALQPPNPPQTVFSFISENTFTVNSTGEITSANFVAENTDESLVLRLGFNAENGIGANGATVINDDGFGGVNYTLITPTATPEPSTGTILGTGLGFAALWQLRQRRRRRWAAA